MAVDSGKFALRTADNRWRAFSRSSRKEMCNGICPSNCVWYSRPVSLHHRYRKSVHGDHSSANMHTHVLDNTEHRNLDFLNITMPFFASINAMSCGVVTTPRQLLECFVPVSIECHRCLGHIKHQIVEIRPQGFLQHLHNALLAIGPRHTIALSSVTRYQLNWLPVHET